jgi:diaminohydroxyphosphoribosylaminopyrimidine deaminase/5-amino-6-(5-phosphoribosylamino)uracil reductase
LLYIAPCLLGDPARGMFALPAPLERLGDRVSLKVRSIDAVGGDWRVVARVEPESV